MSLFLSRSRPISEASMQRSVEIFIGGQRYAREVEIGDLATDDHAVERARQQLVDERGDLEGQWFQRGRVIR